MFKYLSIYKGRHETLSINFRTRTSRNVWSERVIIYRDYPLKDFRVLFL